MIMNKMGFVKRKTLLINLVFFGIVIGGAFFCYTLVRDRKISINEWFTGSGIKGVDISSYQGDVDMKTLADQGIRFAYIKATEGSKHKDEKFSTNWSNINNTNIKAGAYHFFSFESSGETQAENYIKTVGSLEGKLIPAVDVEIYGNFKNNPPEKDKVTRQLKILLTVLEDEYKVRPMIYAQKDFYDKYLGDEFKDYPIWARNVFFPVYLDFGGDWTIWQYKDRGKLEGYSGDEEFIDLDFLNPTKNLDNLIVPGKN